MLAPSSSLSAREAIIDGVDELLAVQQVRLSTILTLLDQRVRQPLEECAAALQQHDGGLNNKNNNNNTRKGSVSQAEGLPQPPAAAARRQRRPSALSRSLVAMLPTEAAEALRLLVPASLERLNTAHTLLMHHLLAELDTFDHSPDEDAAGTSSTQPLQRNDDGDDDDGDVAHRPPPVVTPAVRNTRLLSRLFRSPQMSYFVAELTAYAADVVKHIVPRLLLVQLSSTASTTAAAAAAGSLFGNGGSSSDNRSGPGGSSSGPGRFDEARARLQASALLSSVCTLSRLVVTSLGQIKDGVALLERETELKRNAGHPTPAALSPPRAGGSGGLNGGGVAGADYVAAAADASSLEDLIAAIAASEHDALVRKAAAITAALPTAAGWNHFITAAIADVKRQLQSSRAAPPTPYASGGSRGDTQSSAATARDTRAGTAAGGATNPNDQRILQPPVDAANLQGSTSTTTMDTGTGATPTPTPTPTSTTATATHLTAPCTPHGPTHRRTSSMMQLQRHGSFAGPSSGAAVNIEGMAGERSAVDMVTANPPHVAAVSPVHAPQTMPPAMLSSDSQDVAPIYVNPSEVDAAPPLLIHFLHYDGYDDTYDVTTARSHASGGSSSSPTTSSAAGTVVQTPAGITATSTTTAVTNVMNSMPQSNPHQSGVRKEGGGIASSGRERATTGGRSRVTAADVAPAAIPQSTLDYILLLSEPLSAAHRLLQVVRALTELVWDELWAEGIRAVQHSHQSTAMVVPSSSSSVMGLRSVGGAWRSRWQTHLESASLCDAAGAFSDLWDTYQRWSLASGAPMRMGLTQSAAVACSAVVLSLDQPLGLTERQWKGLITALGPDGGSGTGAGAVASAFTTIPGPFRRLASQVRHGVAALAGAFVVSSSSASKGGPLAGPPTAGGAGGSGYYANDSSADHLTALSAEAIGALRLQAIVEQALRQGHRWCSPRTLLHCGRVQKRFGSLFHRSHARRLFLFSDVLFYVEEVVDTKTMAAIVSNMNAGSTSQNQPLPPARAQIASKAAAAAAQRKRSGFQGREFEEIESPSDVEDDDEDLDENEENMVSGEENALVTTPRPGQHAAAASTADAVGVLAPAFSPTEGGAIPTTQASYRAASRTDANIYSPAENPAVVDSNATATRPLAAMPEASGGPSVLLPRTSAATTTTPTPAADSARIAASKKKPSSASRSFFFSACCGCESGGEDSPTVRRATAPTTAKHRAHSAQKRRQRAAEDAAEMDNMRTGGPPIVVRHRAASPQAQPQLTSISNTATAKSAPNPRRSVEDFYDIAENSANVRVPLRGGSEGSVFDSVRSRDDVPLVSAEEHRPQHQYPLQPSPSLLSQRRPSAVPGLLKPSKQMVAAQSTTNKPGTTGNKGSKGSGPGLVADPGVGNKPRHQPWHPPPDPSARRSVTADAGSAAGSGAGSGGGVASQTPAIMEFRLSAAFPLRMRPVLSVFDVECDTLSDLLRLRAHHTQAAATATSAAATTGAAHSGPQGLFYEKITSSIRTTVANAAEAAAKDPVVRDCCFILLLPTRAYVFLAPSRAEKRLWVDHIRSAILAANPPSSQASFLCRGATDTAGHHRRSQTLQSDPGQASSSSSPPANKAPYSPCEAADDAAAFQSSMSTDAAAGHHKHHRQHVVSYSASAGDDDHNSRPADSQSASEEHRRAVGTATANPHAPLPAPPQQLGCSRCRLFSNADPFAVQGGADEEGEIQRAQSSSANPLDVQAHATMVEAARIFAAQTYIIPATEPEPVADEPTDGASAGSGGVSRTASLSASSKAQLRRSAMLFALQPTHPQAAPLPSRPEVQASLPSQLSPVSAPVHQWPYCAVCGASVTGAVDTSSSSSSACQPAALSQAPSTLSTRRPRVFIGPHSRLTQQRLHDTYYLLHQPWLRPPPAPSAPPQHLLPAPLPSASATATSGDLSPLSHATHDASGGLNTSIVDIDERHQQHPLDASGSHPLLPTPHNTTQRSSSLGTALVHSRSASGALSGGTHTQGTSQAVSPTTAQALAPPAWPDALTLPGSGAGIGSSNEEHEWIYGGTVKTSREQHSAANAASGHTPSTFPPAMHAATSGSAGGPTSPRLLLDTAPRAVRPDKNNVDINGAGGVAVGSGLPRSPRPLTSPARSATTSFTLSSEAFQSNGVGIQGPEGGRLASGAPSSGSLLAASGQPPPITPLTPYALSAPPSTVSRNRSSMRVSAHVRILSGMDVASPAWTSDDDDENGGKNKGHGNAMRNDEDAVDPPQHVSSYPAFAIAGMGDTEDRVARLLFQGKEEEGHSHPTPPVDAPSTAALLSAALYEDADVGMDDLDGSESRGRLSDRRHHRVPLLGGGVDGETKPVPRSTADAPSVPASAQKQVSNPASVTSSQRRGVVEVGVAEEEEEEDDRTRRTRQSLTADHSTMSNISDHDDERE